MLEFERKSLGQASYKSWQLLKEGDGDQEEERKPYQLNQGSTEVSTWWTSSLMAERQFQRKSKEAHRGTKDRCPGQHPKETEKKKKGKLYLPILVEWLNVNLTS